MNIIRSFRKPNTLKISAETDDEIIGWALSPSGRVDAIKQGSGMYGAGFGSNAFSETAFGTQIALSQSTFGWSAAYSVSTWCYRCVEVRKSAVHRMPWHIYDKQTRKIFYNHPLEIAFRRNKQKLFKKIEQSQCLYGETFIERATNAYDYVSDLFWLNNNGMAVITGAGYIMGYQYTAMQGGLPQAFEADQVAFMKTDNPFNDLRGMSPTEVAMDEIAIDKDVARVVRAYYANDTRVGLLLIPKRDMQKADSDRFMEMWKSQNQGVNKAGKPILMPSDMSVERVQEPATLDDVQLRESTRREIAAVYGVPLSLAGGWDDAKYQSLPEQRKSFYEETVVPECETIAEFINDDIAPYFDAQGSVEFGYDFESILALTDDAQKKNDIYSTRLAAGGITRAEFRRALNLTVTEYDDVYYIPAGSTVIPSDQEIFVTPTANQVDDTDTEQQAVLPAGAAPQSTPYDDNSSQQLPSGDNSNPPPAAPPAQQTKTITITAHQDTPQEELTAWEKKALNNNALKAASFNCYVLPDELQSVVREALTVAGKTATRAEIKAIFAAAKTALQPPAVTLDYWAAYDKLMNEVGNAWSTDYMARAFDMLSPILSADITTLDIQNALNNYHDEFTARLVGTEEEPGILTKLGLAGMGAATEALYQHSAANPQRPVTAKAVTIDVDWDMLAYDARNFAQQYVFNLIRNVDNTTIKMVQDAIVKWIESGEPLDALRESMKDIFHDPIRAAAVAETETTRIYAEGGLERYRRADVKRIKLSRLNDKLVCDVCLPLEGTIVPLSEGWSAVTGYRYPPFHVRCRHWIIPAGDDE